MLASGGWVYLDAQSAGTARQQWHADCDCQIVPAWGKKTPKIAGYDPDSLYAQYEAARDAVVARKQGKSMGILLRWRRWLRHGGRCITVVGVRMFRCLSRCGTIRQGGLSFWSC